MLVNKVSIFCLGNYLQIRLKTVKSFEIVVQTQNLAL